MPEHYQEQGLPPVVPENNEAAMQTSGQKWVGVSFNPSKISEVDQIKQQFASAADTLERWAGQIQRPLSKDEWMLYEAAKTDLLRAQMLAVKLFTYN